MTIAHLPIQARTNRELFRAAAALFALSMLSTGAEHRRELRVGHAGHAFDHLGTIADQAETAAASGATIIYPSGFGAMGYQGLPALAELNEARRNFSAYLHRARASGIELAIAYVCATSIVKLDDFTRNWSTDFRGQFSSPPLNWLQQDRTGKALLSWYGGEYRPACMNHPDWQTYQKAIVQLQLESGHDGIFFDNPTVHPEGCYCAHCMRKFARFLEEEGAKVSSPDVDSASFLRQIAVQEPADFLRFRCTIARDFLAEMRRHARTIKPTALVTCNNSLNSPSVFYSQCRTYGYNIHELSKAEDFVVVEDMATQPRRLADGGVIEYGPVYELLHAISRGKPLVALTLAEADYHTPSNLMRLAMAEAAAHRASYLAWPTWPENVRQRLISSIRPAADFLKQHAGLLNDTTRKGDLLLFLPFRRWLQTADCHALRIAQALSARNVQFEVVCEDEFAERLQAHSVLIAESNSVLLPAESKSVKEFQARGGEVVWSTDQDWSTRVSNAIQKPVLALHASPLVRAIVRDQPRRRIVHLLNLDVQRLSSFDDKVTPASDVRLQLRVPFRKVYSVQAISADEAATRGAIPFEMERTDDGAVLEIAISQLILSTILLVE